MNHLIICNTYYQLILAIQLKNTLWQDDYVCLLLSDHSKNASVILEKLSSLKRFDECHYIKTRSEVYQKKSKIKRFFECLEIALLSKGPYFFTICELDNLNYDEIVSYNLCLDVDTFLYNLMMYNTNIVVSKMEEGFFSYNYTLSENIKERKLINLIRKLFLKKTFDECKQFFYCFYPQLYCGSFKAFLVPKIALNSKTSADLRNIFGIHRKRNEYNQKYIFFTSVYDFEGGQSIGEFELVCKVANLVGKENLLIKTHPRDIRTIYTDNNFNVDENSSVPWEAIQLSFDFSDKIFLTVNSGSVLSGSTLSEKPVKTYFLYRLCCSNTNSAYHETVSYIDKLLSNQEMKVMFSMVKIVDTIEEIL